MAARHGTLTVVVVEFTSCRNEKCRTDTEKDSGGHGWNLEKGAIKGWRAGRLSWQPKKKILNREEKIVSTGLAIFQHYANMIVFF